MKRALLFLGLLAIPALLIAGNTEHYLGTVIIPDELRTANSGPTTQLDIGIESYTSDKEMDDLGAIFGDGNNHAALLKKIESMKRIGWISRPGRAGIPIKIIRVRKTEKGREIVMLTDRPISFWEAMNSPTTQDYPYGMVRFTINDKGEGSGEIDILAKMKKIGPNGIVVNNYGAIPWQITSIQKMK